jgi:protein-glutamine gamma-glutamyltransferase
MSSTADIHYQIPRASLIWLLSAVVLVILPQATRMPVWISLIALMCITWRVLIYTGKLDYPGRSIRILAVLFTLFASASQIRTIGAGLDSAAALLSLGFVFKLIEMRFKRDVYVVISLCFVMAMVAFLYSQTVVTTLYITLVIVVILGAMIASNRSNSILDNSGTSRLAGTIILQAIPLTIVLFLVFPRIAPLWAVPIQSGSGSTGVTDEMSPGDISQLGRSGDLAFRVQFENGARPIHSALYWRGLVLDNFDGETWRRRRSSSYSMAAARQSFDIDWEGRVSTTGNPDYYNIILEPTQQPWLYGLHLAEPQSRDVVQGGNFEIFKDGLVTQRFSYDLRSYAQNRTDTFLLDSVRTRNLRIPGEGNEASREFAQQLRSTVESDRDFVFAVLAHFQQEEFYYTLNPPLLDENRIDEFLFDTREGFCEHYASSFAYLMRAAGIPARVVVGYQGAEYNRFEDYLMVYQYNAHAWNEVWLEGEGWVRFDPTGAVSPERIELGVEAALRDDPAFLEESLFSDLRLGGINWLNTMRLRLDAIEYEWNRRVVNYDEEVQFELFERLLGEVTERKILMLLMIMAGVAITAVAFTVIRFQPKSKHDPVNKLYLAVCKELGKAGIPRHRGEGPISYCNRVIAARPELKKDMQNLTHLYIELNYQSEAEDQERMKTRTKELRKKLYSLKLNLMPLTQVGKSAK